MIPTLQFNTMNPVALLSFTFPLDIIEQGETARLKSLTLKAKNESALKDNLAGKGSINLDENKVELSDEGGAKTVTYSFIDGGLELTGPTTVTLAVLPFTIPEEGMVLQLEDVNGKKRDCQFWKTTAEVGKTLEGGSLSEISITAEGITPVSFPMIFPLGTIDGVHQFTSTTQPAWVSQQYISCIEQPAAYATWVQVSEPCPGVPVNYQYVNTGNISSPGIKGMWTGDYLEFNIPVKKLEAGTKITVKFPMYGRQHPAFWNIRYQDGEDWKIHNQHTVTGYGNDTYTCECTFGAVLGATTIEETILLENEVKNDYVKIRIEVADGRYQIDSGTKQTVERNVPYGGDSGSFVCAFYFYNAEDPTLPFSFTLAE